MDTNNYFKYFIGGLVVVGMFVIVGLLIFFHVPDDNRDVFNNAIGSVLTMSVVVVSYLYGSSKSSVDKDKMMMNSQPIPQNSITTATTVSTTKKGDSAEIIEPVQPIT